MWRSERCRTDVTKHLHRPVGQLVHGHREFELVFVRGCGSVHRHGCQLPLAVPFRETAAASLHLHVRGEGLVLRVEQEKAEKPAATNEQIARSGFGLRRFYTMYVPRKHQVRGILSGGGATANPLGPVRRR